MTDHTMHRSDVSFLRRLLRLTLAAALAALIAAEILAPGSLAVVEVPRDVVRFDRSAHCPTTMALLDGVDRARLRASDERAFPTDARARLAPECRR